MPGGTKRLPVDERLLKIADVDWAYLAGIVDGEGHFHCNIRTTNAEPGIVVSMAEPEVPEALHALFGGRLDRAANGRGVIVYRWSIRRQADVAVACRKILPHLRLKADECEAMIAWLDHCVSCPQYDTPTSRAPQAERRRRSQVWCDWREERQRLAANVRVVRSARKAKNPVHVAR